MPNRQIINGEPYRYGYQGEYAETDSETGKPAFQLRLYDPRINRWMSPDPYGQHASPYMSMGNSWANRVDPDGGCDQPDSSCGWFKRIFYSSTQIGAWDAWQSMGTTGAQEMLNNVTITGTSNATLRSRANDMIETQNFAQSLNDMGMNVSVTNNRREAMNSNINFLVGLALPSGKLASKGTSLSDDVGKTFWGGRYEKVVLQESTKLSRYFDDVNSFAKGRYMTSSVGNRIIDRMGLALRPSWNKMTGVADWVIPAGTTVYKGRAAMQFPFIGGRTQYFIPDLHGITKFIK